MIRLQHGKKIQKLDISECTCTSDIFVKVAARYNAPVDSLQLVARGKVYKKTDSNDFKKITKINKFIVIFTETGKDFDTLHPPKTLFETFSETCTANISFIYNSGQSLVRIMRPLQFLFFILMAFKHMAYNFFIVFPLALVAVVRHVFEFVYQLVSSGVTNNEDHHD